MKRLLTSAGIKNPSIHDALVDLRGKPIAESNAVWITAQMSSRIRLKRARFFGAPAG